jgi:DNA-binding response OmpR family regulator
MILEDEEDILLLYKDYLKRKGHNITVSSFTDYESYKPDLVIIDYKLPGHKNGLHAANEIISKYSTAKILILTAFENVKEEMVRMNFFQGKEIPVIIKPVKLSQLAEIISKFSNN